jgi:hypothetical protein
MNNKPFGLVVFNQIVTFIIEHYKLNEIIYPNAISRSCKIDRDVVGAVLDSLTTNNVLEKHWYVCCPHCHKYIQFAYVDYTLYPPTINCTNCDKEIVGNNDGFIEYVKPAYKLKKKITKLTKRRDSDYVFNT